VPVRFTARFGVAAALVVAASYVAQASLYVNFTRSLPSGLYRRIGGAPARGDLVVACMPRHAGEFARRRGYVWRGDCPGAAAPVGKLILAIAGDTVTVSPDGLRLNGRAVPNSRLVPRDSRGRAMTHFPFGAHILEPGQVWLFSSFHPMSFDSRYFGPVESSGIRARIWPLWTLRPTSPGGDATVLAHITKRKRLMAKALEAKTTPSIRDAA
jgi:conjugative transfer signal peptidase TraF